MDILFERNLFSKFLLRSFIIHLGVFLLLALSPYLPFSQYHRRIERITWITLPKGMTDTMGMPIKKSPDLPKTTIQEQKEIPKPPPPPPAVKEDTLKIPTKEAPKVVKPIPKPRPKTPEEIMMEKALARIGETVKKRAAPPEMAQIPQNIESGGTPYGSPNPSDLTPKDAEYALYQTKIRGRIMEEWILPIAYANQNVPYICLIVVKINAQGEVIQSYFEKKSGSPAFDFSAMRAIERASPLAIPPDGLKREVLTEGLLVEFNPQLKKD
ncbi:MAG: hypothetical protein A3F89_05425 [Deltaproteobacteria bacterium RIFCSPLOWO2_12_FULL_50_11]|nr:MAG: hypothetical protein A3F89_05425 [Deltaproteobacteria bacterium RIFCSPLOWO2_12_FULL_50_11]